MNEISRFLLNDPPYWLLLVDLLLVDLLLVDLLLVDLLLVDLLLVDLLLVDFLLVDLLLELRGKLKPRDERIYIYIYIIFSSMDVIVIIFE